MLSESQAQDLLRRAGETLDVDPAGPIDTSLAPPRRWPVLAAAAVVLLISGGITLGIPGNRSTGPDTPPATADVTTPESGTFRLGPDQVPSVFGLTAKPARELLEARGLEVTTRTSPTCDSHGRAAGTEPGTGTLVEPGDQVTLLVTEFPANASCTFDEPRIAALTLLDAALGQGDPPPTTGDVDLTGVLERLRTWAGEVGRRSDNENGFAFPTPELTARFGDQLACAQQLITRDSSWLTVHIAIPSEPSAGVEVGRCQEVYVHLQHRGSDRERIDRAVLPSTASYEPSGPADVVGNSVADATRRLESQGYVVDPVARVDCQSVGLVTAQQPYPDADVEPGAVVHVAFTEADGPCLKDRLTIPTDESATADAFVAFARGGEAPLFAETVDVYWSDFRDLELTGDDRSDPSAWQYECPPTASCADPAPPSPLDVLAAYDGPVVQSPTVSTCPAHPRRNGLDVDGLTLVRLDEPEPASCDDTFAVELYLDDAGRIAAVDLLLSS